MFPQLQEDLNSFLMINTTNSLLSQAERDVFLSAFAVL